MKDYWCKINVKIELSEIPSLLNWVFKNISLKERVLDNSYNHCGGRNP